MNKEGIAKKKQRGCNPKEVGQDRQMALGHLETCRCREAADNGTLVQNRHPVTLRWEGKITGSSGGEAGHSTASPVHFLIQHEQKPSDRAFAVGRENRVNFMAQATVSATSTLGVNLISVTKLLSQAGSCTFSGSQGWRLWQKAEIHWKGWHK